MSKRISLIFISIFLTILLLTPFSTSQAIHKINCCRLNYEIQLDNVDICGRLIAQPVGCDPETTGCCARQATWTFPRDEIVAEIEEGLTECYLGTTGSPVSLVAQGTQTPHWGMVCLVNTIYNITDWVFWFAMALSIILGIITGFFFFTAGGEPYKIEKAKSMLIWLVVGIAVAVSAKLLTALIIAIVF